MAGTKDCSSSRKCSPAAGLPGVEGGRQPCAVLGDGAGAEDHRAQFEMPVGEGRGELLAHAVHRLRSVSIEDSPQVFAAGQGSRGRLKAV